MPTSHTQPKLNVDLDRVRIPNPALLVHRARPEEVTEGGIVIPQASQEKRMVATVIKIGEAVKLSDVNPEIQVGDQVVCGRYSLESGECHEEIGADIHLVDWPDGVRLVIKPKLTGKDGKTT